MGLAAAAAAGTEACLTRERIRKRKERDIERVVEREEKKAKKGETAGRDTMISRCGWGLESLEEKEEEVEDTVDKEAAGLEVDAGDLGGFGSSCSCGASLSFCFLSRGTSAVAIARRGRFGVDES